MKTAKITAAILGFGCDPSDRAAMEDAERPRKGCGLILHRFHRGSIARRGVDNHSTCQTWSWSFLLSTSRSGANVGR